MKSPASWQSKPKVARGSGARVSGEVEAHQVYLPEAVAWVHEFIEECAGFPTASHDDQRRCRHPGFEPHSRPVGIPRLFRRIAEHAAESEFLPTARMGQYNLLVRTVPPAG